MQDTWDTAVAVGRRAERAWMTPEMALAHGVCSRLILLTEGPVVEPSGMPLLLEVVACHQKETSHLQNHPMMELTSELEAESDAGSGPAAIATGGSKISVGQFQKMK